MHIDLEANELPSRFDAAICIVGGGVAGILLASHLAQAGICVHLLEAGGLELEERSQSLYHTTMAGHHHTGASEGRFRTFGGSSTRWGGQLLPFTEDVLHPAPCLGMPQWPIELAELDPYYKQAQRAMGVPLTPFSDDLPKEFGQPPPFQSARVRLRFSKCAPFVKRNLAGTLGKRCLTASHVTVYTHANVTSIDLHESGASVRSVTATNYRGHRYTFTAKNIILCTGTIEVSRLLLASTGVSPQGVGNSKDQVGRYFHDHVSVRAAEIVSPDRQPLLHAFAPYVRNGTCYRAKLEATADLRCEKHLLSVAGQFSIEEPPDSGADRIRSMLRTLQSRRFDRQFRKSLFRLPSATAEIFGLVLAARFRHRRRVSRLATVVLDIDVEQKPDSESRVLLSHEKDALGMRKAILDWKISDQEHHSIRTYASELERVFRDNALAAIPWNPDISAGGDAWLAGHRIDTFHMMGGTRMGTDPTSSVVDSALKVHGIRNLYIVSCCVFPTGGSSNPTFTMMALALRLADQLAAN